VLLFIKSGHVWKWAKKYWTTFAHFIPTNRNFHYAPIYR